MKILSVETSCDETAAAVIEGRGDCVRVLSNIVSSQIEIHKKYGGVVPEVAAREHILNILLAVNEALEKIGGKNKIDAIAVTVGPGLITSLIVGVETAKTLAYAWDKPVVGVNHIEGHIYANMIGEIESNIKFPALILTVSGGHNLLVLMRGHGKYKIIGETLDDAAGEAFDKAAAMLGIGYPGGPEISRLAEKYKISVETLHCNVSTSNIQLPRPMLNKGEYDFSFSGLKTALLYQLQKDKNWKKRIPEYCYEFQQAAVDVLVGKTIRAAQEFKVKTVMLSGGVSANKILREQMSEAVKARLPGTAFQLPDLKYTTDNAAMIGAAGYFRAKNKKFTPWSKLKADPNLELK